MQPIAGQEVEPCRSVVSLPVRRGPSRTGFGGGAVLRSSAPRAGCQIIVAIKRIARARILTPELPMDRPKTLGELKSSGYQIVDVKTEMRRNLVRKLQVREPLFPGIVGYDDTVIPQVQNAVL